MYEYMVRKGTVQYLPYTPKYLYMHRSGVQVTVRYQEYNQIIWYVVQVPVLYTPYLSHLSPYLLHEWSPGIDSGRLGIDSWAGLLKRLQIRAQNTLEIRVNNKGYPGGPPGACRTK
jgi:hypothetical protein